MGAAVVVGVVSDTHGELPKSALGLLGGVAHILHAGDAGSAGVLAALARIARVTAVRGNAEPAGRTAALPRSAAVEIGGARVYVIHDISDLDLDPAAAGFAAVVHGHTHRPEIVRRDGVLYVNPGSPVQPRGGFPPSVARLTLARGAAEAEILALGGVPG
jgi:hypothetical protein